MGGSSCFLGGGYLQDTIDRCGPDVRIQLVRYASVSEVSEARIC